jgi:hypothetical protein
MIFVTAFEAGRRLLYEDVSLRVCDRLTMLADVRHLDSEVALYLDRPRRRLVRHRSAGASWRAHDALETIAILNTPAWALSAVCSARPGTARGRAGDARRPRERGERDGVCELVDARADPDGAPVDGPAAGPPARVSGSAATV